MFGYDPIELAGSFVLFSIGMTLLALAVCFVKEIFS